LTTGLVTPDGCAGGEGRGEVKTNPLLRIAARGKKGNQLSCRSETIAEYISAWWRKKGDCGKRFKRRHLAKVRPDEGRGGEG